MAAKITTREKIIESAWKLFHEKGFMETTLEDIIDAANVSKGSFYYHFDKKDALLDTLALILDREYEKIKASIPADMNSYEKLLAINIQIHTYIEAQIDSELLASLYSKQLLSRDNSSLLDQNRTYYTLIAEIMEEGQSREQIITDRSVRELVKYYSMCERALVSDWCMENGNYSLSDFSREYLPMMIGSIKKSKPSH